MARKPNLKIEKTGHILVLDQNWHRLFEKRKPFKIAQLERRLNKLLQEQGKVNTEYEAYKKLKKQMMAEIMETMNDDSPDAAKKKAQNSRHINEINRKFDHYEERKSVLPAMIEAVNTELLTESMVIGYQHLAESRAACEKVEKELEEARKKVKELAGKKEDLENERTDFYTFIHDLAGIEVIEQLDRFYFGDDE